MKIKFLFFSALILLSTHIHAYQVSILLIRHGETDWNAVKKVQGHTDNPLNLNGIKQAELTAEKLLTEHSNITAIYSSDLQRAYATAEKTAEKFNLPIAIRANLREIHVGSSEGMPFEEKVAKYSAKWAELKKKYPDKRERWNYSPVPGEETIAALIDRFSVELLAISQANPNGKVAIFTHQKTMQAFIAHIRDAELDETKIPNCGISEIAFDSENQEHPFSFVQ